MYKPNMQNSVKHSTNSGLNTANDINSTKDIINNNKNAHSSTARLKSPKSMQQPLQLFKA